MIAACLLFFSRSHYRAACPQISARHTTPTWFRCAVRASAASRQLQLQTLGCARLSSSCASACSSFFCCCCCCWESLCSETRLKAGSDSQSSPPTPASRRASSQSQMWSRHNNTKTILTRDNFVVKKHLNVSRGEHESKDLITQTQLRPTRADVQVWRSFFVWTLINISNKSVFVCACQITNLSAASAKGPIEMLSWVWKLSSAKLCLNYLTEIESKNQFIATWVLYFLISCSSTKVIQALSGTLKSSAASGEDEHTAQSVQSTKDSGFLPQEDKSRLTFVFWSILTARLSHDGFISFCHTNPSSGSYPNQSQSDPRALPVSGFQVGEPPAARSCRCQAPCPRPQESRSWQVGSWGEEAAYVTLPSRDGFLFWSWEFISLHLGKHVTNKRAKCENVPVCKGVINQPKLRLNDFLKNPLINISDFCADATRTQEGRVTETRFIRDAGNMWADTEQCSSLSTAHLLPLC